MTATFVTIALVLLVPPFLFGELALPRRCFHPLPLHELAIMIIAVIGLCAVVLAKDRLTAIVSLGIRAFRSRSSSCSMARRISPLPSS